MDKMSPAEYERRLRYDELQREQYGQQAARASARAQGADEAEPNDRQRSRSPPIKVEPSSSQRAQSEDRAPPSARANSDAQVGREPASMSTNERAAQPLPHERNPNIGHPYAQQHSYPRPANPHGPPYQAHEEGPGRYLPPPIHTGQGSGFPEQYGAADLARSSTRRMVLDVDGATVRPQTAEEARADNEARNRAAYQDYLFRTYGRDR